MVDVALADDESVDAWSSSCGGVQVGSHSWYLTPAVYS
jgi:hypothetical protein